MMPWKRSGSTPTSGCSSTNHTRLATATLVATVEQNTVRKNADATDLFVGEHGEADAQRQPDRHGHQRQPRRVGQRVLELVAAKDVDVLAPPTFAATLAGCVASQMAELDRPHQRVDDEHPQDDRRRGEHARPRPERRATSSSSIDPALGDRVEAMPVSLGRVEVNLFAIAGTGASAS